MDTRLNSHTDIAIRTAPLTINQSPKKSPIIIIVSIHQRTVCKIGSNAKERCGGLVVERGNPE